MLHLKWCTENSVGFQDTFIWEVKGNKKLPFSWYFFRGNMVEIRNCNSLFVLCCFLKSIKRKIWNIVFWCFVFYVICELWLFLKRTRQTFWNCVKVWMFWPMFRKTFDKHANFLIPPEYNNLTVKSYRISWDYQYW